MRKLIIAAAGAAALLIPMLPTAASAQPYGYYGSGHRYGGYDGDVSALEYLAKCDGPFIATATQSTQKMGVLAVESALAVAAGQKVEERQTPNAVLTTCENAPEFVKSHP